MCKNSPKYYLHINFDICDTLQSIYPFYGCFFLKNGVLYIDLMYKKTFRNQPPTFILNKLLTTAKLINKPNHLNWDQIMSYYRDYEGNSRNLKVITERTSHRKGIGFIKRGSSWNNIRNELNLIRSRTGRCRTWDPIN